MKTSSLKQLLDGYDPKTQKGLFNEYVPASVARGLYEALREVKKKKASRWHPCDPLLKQINEALAALEE